MRIAVLAALLACAHAFAPPRAPLRSLRSPLAAEEGDAPADVVDVADAAPAEGEATEATKLELLSKMSGWEATEAERKAATLGGMTPGKMDGFDIGLYVAFPFLFLPLVAFLFFPAIANNFIDVSSVGPPPMS